ncbi:MAG TPA: hypothetical protein VGM39_02800 [Kofleriaceae bacterium]|jgi:hypothetical protein
MPTGSKLLLALLVVSASAAADTKKQSPTEVLVAAIDDEMNWGSHPIATFAFDDDKASPLDNPDASMLGMGDVELQNPVVGFAADGTEAFVAGDIRQFGDCGGGSSCGKTLGWLHGAFLVEKGDSGWSPTVWHISQLGKPAETQTPLARKVTDAEDAAKLFEATIADPKAFAKTVSDRKDAVLLGSDKGERFVGGAKVRAKLAAWNLSLQTRGGVQAGVSQNKTFAWVAANVDARSISKPKAPVTAYRVLAIYEKVDATWKLVSLSFSL